MAKEFPVMNFNQDPNFQYDIKMLSQNRFDKLGKSTYKAMIEAHQKYSVDPQYQASPFNSYLKLSTDTLSNFIAGGSYSEFITKIEDLNLAHRDLVSQISNTSIL